MKTTQVICIMDFKECRYTDREDKGRYDIQL